MTQKNDHREAPAIANWSVWGVAMVAAAAFSVALGNLAGDIVRNQGLPAGFLAQIEASREDSTWAQKCPDGTRGVAINNYPGTQNLLGGTHSTYYTKSGERNWRCSHICVPQESASNLNNYLKDAKVDGKPLIVLAGPAQFNEYFKEGAEGQDGPEAAMTRAIILSSTKTSCVGPNSVDYGEIKTANKDEIKKEERIGTAAPAEATATTGQTAADKLARTKELAEGIRRMPGTRPPAAPGPAAPATEAPAAGTQEALESATAPVNKKQRGSTSRSAEPSAQTLTTAKKENIKDSLYYSLVINGKVFWDLAKETPSKKGHVCAVLLFDERNVEHVYGKTHIYCQTSREGDYRAELRPIKGSELKKTKGIVFFAHDPGGARFAKNSPVRWLRTIGAGSSGDITEKGKGGFAAEPLEITYKLNINLSENMPILKRNSSSHNQFKIQTGIDCLQQRIISR